MKNNKYLLGILATHPIQYYAPWYQALAKHPQISLRVFYCHRQTPQGQAEAGFGVPFDWDIPLLDGYAYQFLVNKSHHPNVYTFFGCDTPEIMRIISDNSFDAFIVQGWSMLSFWQAIIACWRTHTPVLVRGDSQLLTRRFFLKRVLKYLIYRWFMPRFDAYLTVGKRAKEYYLHYGAGQNKMFFVPHAVDNYFFASSRTTLEPQRESLRRNWGIPKDAFVFLFAGKLISKKRPDDFLRALEIAYKHVQGIFGLVAGDGPLRSKLQALSGRFSLPVTFTGFLNQKDMPKAYAVSDILVLPSDGRETWGLVVNEAFASGLPAIVSDKAGCVPDLVIPQETGEVFPCGDVNKLAEIFKSYAVTRDKLKGMGKNAQKIIEGYSIACAAEGTVNAINSIVLCQLNKGAITKIF